MDADHQSWLRLLAMSAPGQRRAAVLRLLPIWDHLLAEDIGERVPDYFARLNQLDQALDELMESHDLELGLPTDPVH